MVLGETCRVGILTGLHKGHLVVVHQVVEQLSEELSEPPHADQVPARGVVLHLPAVLLALVHLLLVVVAIATDHLQGDFLIDSGIQGDVGCFS